MRARDCAPDRRRPWGDKLCHGDVFHIKHQCEVLANTQAGIARGARSRCEKLQARSGKARQDPDIADRIALARHAEAGTHALACDIRTLTAWLSHDVLVLAGPSLEIRQDLFDFIAAEMKRREAVDPHRIRLVRMALQSQRDNLLAFAGVLDDQLAAIARVHELPEPLVREACMLHRKPNTSSAYWQGWNRLRARAGAKFHAVFNVVAQAMAQTSRSSALVENLNFRLRNYFTLRRQLGGAYLDLLRFFVNHRCFLRSRRPERVGKSRRRRWHRKHPRPLPTRAPRPYSIKALCKSCAHCSVPAVPTCWAVSSICSTATRRVCWAR
jgi:hypothetical protein